MDDSLQPRPHRQHPVERAGDERIAQQLAECEERYRSLADAIPVVMLWTADATGGFTFFNHNWFEYTGAAAAGDAGGGWQFGVHPDDMPRCARVYRQAFVDRKPFHLPFRLRRHDGAYRWIVSEGTPRLGPAGEFLGFAGRAVPSELMPLVAGPAPRSAPDALPWRKAAPPPGTPDPVRFIDLIGHTTSAPLRKTLLCTDLLKRRYAGQLDAEGREFLDYILATGGHLLELIATLHALERAGAARLRSGVCANTALARARGILRHEIRDSGANVQYSELPAVTACPALLTQLFVQLIDNAIRYRAEPAPLVKVGVQRRSGEWLFLVSDNGIGIGAEKIERIFEPQCWSGGDGASARAGLGLATAQRIVQAHGGRIWAMSEVGCGSTFLFTLPLWPD